jgi:hypothetical protein
MELILWICLVYNYIAGTDTWEEATEVADRIYAQFRSDLVWQIFVAVVIREPKRKVLGM